VIQDGQRVGVIPDGEGFFIDQLVQPLDLRPLPGLAVPLIDAQGAQCLCEDDEQVLVEVLHGSIRDGPARPSRQRLKAFSLNGLTAMQLIAYKRFCLQCQYPILSEAEAKCLNC
jgi:hypothetical protein